MIGLGRWMALTMVFFPSCDDCRDEQSKSHSLSSGPIPIPQIPLFLNPSVALGCVNGLLIVNLDIYSLSRACPVPPTGPLRPHLRLRPSLHMLRLRPPLWHLHPRRRRGQDGSPAVLHRALGCLLRLPRLCGRQRTGAGEDRAGEGVGEGGGSERSGGGDGGGEDVSCERAWASSGSDFSLSFLCRDCRSVVAQKRRGRHCEKIWPSRALTAQR
jgi:hypothetical protein